MFTCTSGVQLQSDQGNILIFMVTQTPPVVPRAIICLSAPSNNDINQSKSKPKGNVALMSISYTVRTNNVSIMNLCNDNRERGWVKGRGGARAALLGL